jgi:hypothetical protein
MKFFKEVRKPSDFELSSKVAGVFADMVNRSANLNSKQT